MALLRKPEPNLDATVMVYSECEHCNGLFPHETIQAHIRVGHERDLRSPVKRTRRMFAVTELSPYAIQNGVRNPKNPIFHARASGSSLQSDIMSSAMGYDDDDNEDEDDEYDERPTRKYRKRHHHRDTPPRAASAKPDKMWDLDAISKKIEENIKNHQLMWKRRHEEKLALQEEKNRTPFGDGVRKKYQRRYEQPQPDEELTFSIEDFPDIPTSYGTILMSVKPTDVSDLDSIDIVMLKNNVANKPQVKDWIDEFSTKSGTNWNLVTSKPNHSSITKQYSQYRCRYSSDIRMRNKDSEKNLNCKATVSFMVRNDNCCLIQLALKHTHPIGKREQRGVPKQTAAQFESYFQAGMKPTAALYHHKKLLKERMDFRPEMLEDRAVVPNSNQINSLYQKYIKECQKSKMDPFGKALGYNPMLEDEEMMEGLL